MRNPAACALATAVLALMVAACGAEDVAREPASLAGGTTSSVFELPAQLDDLDEDAWFDHPWPSDFRVDADGSIHLHGYRNPRAIPLIHQYIEAMRGKLVGFSPVAAGYLKFSGPIDPATLPSNPRNAEQEASSVQLIDVDDNSPDKGQRKLVTLHWRAEEGSYWLPNTLAFMPTLGYPLRPSTRYALVVTQEVRATDGTPVQPAAQLRQVLGLDAADSVAQTLRDEWAAPVQVLQDAGIVAGDIAHLTIFTTSDPTAETIAVADDARTNQPVPKVDPASWKLAAQKTGWDIYEGTYGPSPDYQTGTLPFEIYGDGGAFVFDAAGKPIKQRDFNARFALAVPTAASCPQPAAGFPIVLYAHGTGGDYKSFTRDGTAASLAAKCMASMGVDQIMHTGRLPAVEGQTWMPELLFFNFQNVDAARTNPRQSGVDEVVRARLIREGQVEVPAAVSTSGSPLRIASSPVVFYGHSQGGLNGPIFLGIDDGARGGVLSGSGSMISITLLEKTKPDPSVAGLVKSLLFALNPSEYEELNYLHPGISLVQNIIDAADPIHYVPMIALRPRPGSSPKSIYQTEGVNADFSGDSYTPPHSIEVQAVATGLPIMNPIIHAVEEMQWGTLQPVTVPAEGLRGNLASGVATGVLAQWPATQADDGHFVIFDIPAATEQAAGFCRNLIDDPVGRVPAP